MSDAPSRSGGFFRSLLELVAQPVFPMLFAGLLVFEILVLLPAGGRCRCGFRSWEGVAIMTDAGPRVLAYPSPEWEEAELSGAMANPLATARVFKLRRNELGLTARTGISVVYSPTPGSGWDTPLMERAFREGLADAFEREDVTGDPNVSERLRSGELSSVSINLSGIVAMMFIGTPPAGLALTAPLAIRASRARRIAAKGFCAHCGYDARGLPACPECGRVNEVNNEA